MKDIDELVNDTLRDFAASYLDAIDDLQNHAALKAIARPTPEEAALTEQQLRQLLEGELSKP